MGVLSKIAFIDADMRRPASMDPTGRQCLRRLFIYVAI